MAVSGFVFLSTIFGALALTHKNRQTGLSLDQGWVLGADEAESDKEEKKSQETALEEARIQGQEAAWQAQLDDATKEGYQRGLEQAEAARRSMASESQAAAEEARKARQESDKAKQEEERAAAQERQAAEQEKQAAQEEERRKAEEEKAAMEAQGRTDEKLDAAGIKAAEESARRAAVAEKEVAEAQAELDKVNKQLELEKAKASATGEGRAALEAQEEYKKQVEDCFKWGCLKKPNQKSILDKMLDGVKGIVGQKKKEESQEAGEPAAPDDKGEEDFQAD